MDSTSLSFSQGLVIVISSSAFGGFLQGLFQTPWWLEETGQPKSPGTESSLVLVLIRLGISILIGVGGGFAVLLASIWLKALNLADTPLNILNLIALGVVAGFVGYRILPRVARGLEDRMSLTEKTSAEAIKLTEKAQSEARELFEEQV
ncbi:MAG: hypothetical protein ACE5JS_12055, partial [Nitrospinota bacterium]